jgi:hypothetical protein
VVFQSRSLLRHPNASRQQPHARCVGGPQYFLLLGARANARRGTLNGWRRSPKSPQRATTGRSWWAHVARDPGFQLPRDFRQGGEAELAGGFQEVGAGRGAGTRRHSMLAGRRRRGRTPQRPSQGTGVIAAASRPRFLRQDATFVGPGRGGTLPPGSRRRSRNRFPGSRPA